MPTIYDFEDGDLVAEDANWSNFDSDLDVTSNAISGSFSGSMTPQADGDTVQIDDTVRTTPKQVDVEWKMWGSQTTGNSADEVARVELTDGSFNAIEIELRGNGNIVAIHGNFVETILGSWSGGTTYAFRAEPDYANDQITIKIDGSVAASGLSQTMNSLESISVVVRDSSGSGIEGRFDDFVEIPPPLSPPTMSVSAPTDTTLDVSATFASADTDEVDVFRDENSAVSTSDTFVGTITSDGGTITDTGLENGEQYHYAGVAKDTSGSAPSSTISASVAGITTLPAPSIDTLTTS